MSTTCPYEQCLWCHEEITTEQIAAGAVLVLPPPEGEDALLVHEGCYVQVVEDHGPVSGARIFIEEPEGVAS